MDNKNKNLNIKIVLPIIVVVLAVIGYVIYQWSNGSTSSPFDSNSNQYISSTKIGKDVDIINKEGISFSNIISNSAIKDRVDYEQSISPSQNVGRTNPFLP